jgi:hypothetical protein
MRERDVCVFSLLELYLLFILFWLVNPYFYIFAFSFLVINDKQERMRKMFPPVRMGHCVYDDDDAVTMVSWQAYCVDSINFIYIVIVPLFKRRLIYSAAKVAADVAEKTMMLAKNSLTTVASAASSSRLPPSLTAMPIHLGSPPWRKSFRSRSFLE